jgi:hypothetical protein
MTNAGGGTVHFFVPHPCDWGVWATWDIEKAFEGVRSFYSVLIISNSLTLIFGWMVGEYTRWWALYSPPGIHVLQSEGQTLSLDRVRVYMADWVCK